MSSALRDGDLELVEQAQSYLRSKANGELIDRRYEVAWNRFYEKYDPMVRRYVGTIAGEQLTADDCVQEVWVELIEQLYRFRYDPSRGRFSTWLYRCVHNKVVSLARKSERRPAVSLDDLTDAQHPFDPIDAAAGLDKQVDCERLLKLLDRLRACVSPLSYTVFHMRTFEGRSAVQVAWTLGLSQQQVWFRQHRVKKKLTRIYEEMFGHDEPPRSNMTPFLAD